MGLFLSGTCLEPGYRELYGIFVRLLNIRFHESRKGVGGHWNQEKIVNLQAETFPEASVDSVLSHLESEMVELSEVAYKDQGMVEAADCA